MSSLTRLRLIALTVCLVVANAFTLTAFAAPTAPVAPVADHERAQAHFDAGRRLVKSGRCDLAIEEFKVSIDFEPMSIGAHLNLGDCYVVLNQLPDAFRHFKEAEQLAERAKDPRLEDARRSGAEVEAKLVRVVLREEEPPTLNVAVTVDGIPVGARPWLIVVTPNVDHTVEAINNNSRRWRANVRGNAGEIVRLTIMFDDSSGVTAPTASSSDATTPPPSSSPSSPSSWSASNYRTAGLIVGGVGAAGVASGIVFGVLAATWRSDLATAVGESPQCVGGYPNGACSPSARSALDPIEHRAFFASTASTISLIAGAVLLVVGGGTYFASESLASKTRAHAKN